MRKKRATYNIITSIIYQVVMVLVNFIIPKLIMSTFGSAMNGLINSITQFLSYVSLLESGVCNVVIVKYYESLANEDQIKTSQIYKESKKFFNGIAAFSVGYIALLCVFYPMFAKSDFASPTIIKLILIISAITLTQYLFGISARCLIQADQRAYIVNITKTIANIFSTIFVLIFVKLNCNVFIVKGSSTVALICIPIVFCLYARRRYKISSSVSRNKKLLSDKWDGLGQHIAAFIHSNADVALLTIFSGVVQVSIYSVYAMILDGLSSLCSTLTNGVSAAFGNMIAKKEYDNLKRSYIAFDYLYTIIIFILFTVAYHMILPFIRIYTADITDANYIIPLYAIIAILARGIYCIRCSYTCIIYAAGHFRQTTRNCFIEAIINIVVSLLLVHKYGIVGVGIGTLIAMAYRSIDYIYYLSKNIIKWDIKKVAFRYLINIIGVATVYVSVKWILYDSINSVKGWIIYAVITTLITVIEFLVINTLLNRRGMKDVYQIYIKPMIAKFIKK